MCQICGAQVWAGGGGWVSFHGDVAGECISRGKEGGG